MSRVRERRVFWDPAPADANVVRWHVYLDEGDVPDFIAQVDSGAWPVYETVTEPEWFPGRNDVLPDSEYDIAVVAEDAAGNFSDPLDAASWQDVPLDVTPPPAPTGGGIEFV